MKIRPLFALSLALLLARSLFAAGPHLVLVGDSTVTDNAGWGLGFAQFLADGVRCTNTAKGGRSSLSFIKEGSWDKALALRGDYYLIQFGHNDEPGKPGRSTSPEEYKTYLERYVDDARKQGATPVLITSLVRRQFRDPSNPHRIESSLASRAEIVRTVAREKQVPLLELHDRSKELCEKLGKEGCLAFSPRKENGDFDGTHLNAEGYVLFGRIVAEELRRAVPALAPFLRNEPRNPKPLPAESRFDAVVAFDGSGSHTTVQAAVNAAPEGATREYRILIKAGVYREHVLVPESKPHLRLQGEEGETQNTVITMATNVKTVGPDGKPLSTEESATFVIRAADFAAENITFENTTTREQRVQALALWVSGDRASFRRCRFLGWQDTLRADAPAGKVARQYFAGCDIQGHVDFIYGSGTSVFDRCNIRCLADGYITAASTEKDTPVGYVFLDCKITAAPEVRKGSYLGRPWRPYASVAFIRCELPAQIRPEGWHNWGKKDNESTARYSEFASSGPGARPDARVGWARTLSSEQARHYTVGELLAGSDGWKPTY